MIGPLVIPDHNNYDLLEKLTWLYWGENIALLVSFVILVVKFESKPPTPPTLYVLKATKEIKREKGVRRKDEGSRREGGNREKEKRGTFTKLN